MRVVLTQASLTKTYTELLLMLVLAGHLVPTQVVPFAFTLRLTVMSMQKLSLCI